MTQTHTLNGCHRLADSAWASRASELARWLWERYVVRDDVWGGYHALADREKEVRRPDGTTYKLGKVRTWPPRRFRGTVKLTLQVIEQHCRGARPEHVVGAHTTSPTNLSKFGTVELDMHGEGGNTAEANWAAARGWYDRLRQAGFHPLLWDSDGKGGYHLDVLFRELVSTRALFFWLRDLVKDFATFKLTARPETFPKQSQLRPKPDGRGTYGNWVRLPGRHHTRDQWARVWDGGDWREGNAAIDWMLHLQGDSPELLPQDDGLAVRIPAYIAKLPHLGVGQGRDDVAYGFACWLVRDLNLSDAEALPWLEQWDVGNTPPKGRERLTEILKSAHTYGQRAYGSGLNGAARAQASPASSPTPPAKRDTLTIIIDYMRAELRPRFRRKQNIYSESRGREVKPSEATYAADQPLLLEMATATDAPCNANGVDPTRLPAKYRDLARCAYAELLRHLPEETDDAEINLDAEEEFRRQVRTALLTRITIGCRNEHGQLEQQTDTLIYWARLWAKPGPWQDVRGHQLWTRLDATGGLQVALRVELFHQVRQPGLGQMKQRAFTDLCVKYGVGEPGKACGDRAVVLLADFLNDVLAEPGGDGRMDVDAGSLARTRETCVPASKTEQV
jgi:hypothetical protein